MQVYVDKRNMNVLHLRQCLVCPLWVLVETGIRSNGSLLLLGSVGLQMSIFRWYTKVKSYFVGHTLLITHYRLM